MEQSTQQHAALDLTGATCTSCVIAIEHLGKRIKGISDIYVDRQTKSIQIEYDGNRQSLEKIQEFIRRIGYEATIREEESVSTDTGTTEP
ncbi:MAG: heavy-metal-associated domain-containing protein [Spirochaetaceae bacterium]|nr:MAG: heavy-metal-associated domain-containing protein [Spirochaetaceae bacterium]